MDSYTFPHPALPTHFKKDFWTWRATIHVSTGVEALDLHFCTFLPSHSTTQSAPSQGENQLSGKHLMPAICILIWSKDNRLPPSAHFNFKANFQGLSQSLSSRGIQAGEEGWGRCWGRGWGHRKLSREPPLPLPGSRETLGVRHWSWGGSPEGSGFGLDAPLLGSTWRGGAQSLIPDSMSAFRPVARWSASSQGSTLQQQPASGTNHAGLLSAAGILIQL